MAEGVCVCLRAMWYVCNVYGVVGSSLPLVVRVGWGGLAVGVCDRYSGRIEGGYGGDCAVYG